MHAANCRSQPSWKQKKRKAQLSRNQISGGDKRRRSLLNRTAGSVNPSGLYTRKSLALGGAARSRTPGSGGGVWDVVKILSRKNRR